MRLSLSPAPFLVHKIELISYLSIEEKAPCGFWGPLKRFLVLSYNTGGI